MVQVLVYLADGFEEIEAVTIVDVLRRGGVDVVTASLGEQAVLGAHGIQLAADRKLADVDPDSFDALVLPGGMPGSATLRDDVTVRRSVVRAHERGKLVAAICAAPIALEAAGVLVGKRATCYPGNVLPSARFEEDWVVEDGNLVTSRGPGTAIEFALKLVSKLVGGDVASTLRERLVVPTLA